MDLINGLRWQTISNKELMKIDNQLLETIDVEFSVELGIKLGIKFISKEQTNVPPELLDEVQSPDTLIKTLVFFR